MCIPDAGKVYNDTEKMVNRLLVKVSHRVFCFDFDEKRDGVINKPKLSADKIKCVLEIIRRFMSFKETNSIFLLGIGQGTQYADAAACVLPDRINGVISYYPKFSSEYFSSD